MLSPDGQVVLAVDAGRWPYAHISISRSIASCHGRTIVLRILSGCHGRMAQMLSPDGRVVLVIALADGASAKPRWLMRMVS